MPYQTRIAAPPISRHARKPPLKATADDGDGGGEDVPFVPGAGAGAGTGDCDSDAAFLPGTGRGGGGDEDLGQRRCEQRALSR